mmetsp:Transcript_7520/g.12778  ORF Transcript_7520/g.12778 Transcript_7520/m.12778 type:complete len:200 (+) Transcript_7520:1144-1743(+)
MLSSVRPLVLPRSSSRSSMTSSGQSYTRTPATCKLSSTVCCQPDRLLVLRGKPSTRKRLPPLASMAAASNLTVTSTGTILPSLMYSSMSCPRGDPELRSARNKSPADKCTYPCASTILLHCVPLPAPGPPKTKTTAGNAVDGCDEDSTLAPSKPGSSKSFFRYPGSQYLKSPSMSAFTLNVTWWITRFGFVGSSNCARA